MLDAGARFYSSRLCQFASTDPVDQPGESSYTYVSNNFLNTIDPGGRQDKRAIPSADVIRNYLNIRIHSNKPLNWLNALHNFYFRADSVYQYDHAVPPVTTIPGMFENLVRRSAIWAGDENTTGNFVYIMNRTASRFGISISQSGIAVDLGGGTGLLTLALLKEYKANFSIYSVDIDPLATRALNNFKAKIAASPLLGKAYANAIHPVTGDVTKLSELSGMPAPNTVNLITGQDITKFLGGKLHTYFNGIASLLKPGGLFFNIEAVPNGEVLGFQNELFPLLEKNFSNERFSHGKQIIPSGNESIFLIGIHKK